MREGYNQKIKVDMEETKRIIISNIVDSMTK